MIRFWGLMKAIRYSRIANIECCFDETIESQDIVVVLKLIGAGKQRPTYAQLASDLLMSPSEVHASIRRARAAKLLHGRELGDKPNLQALEEFRFHGVRYAFPLEKGAMTRGLPTAYATEPLRRKLTQEDPCASLAIPEWLLTRLCVLAALQESA